MSSSNKLFLFFSDIFSLSAEKIISETSYALTFPLFLFDRPLNVYYIMGHNIMFNRPSYPLGDRARRSNIIVSIEVHRSNEYHCTTESHVPAKVTWRRYWINRAHLFNFELAYVKKEVSRHCLTMTPYVAAWGVLGRRAQYCHDAFHLFNLKCRETICQRVSCMH